MDVAQIRDHIESIVRRGDERAKKTLMHGLVHEIRVTAHNKIKPSFRIPATTDLPDTHQYDKVPEPEMVLAQSGSVPLTQLNLSPALVRYIRKHARQ